MDFNRWLNETIVAFINYIEVDLIRLLFNSKIRNIPKASNLPSALQTTLNNGTNK